MSETIPAAALTAPPIRVGKGHPTDEELGALLAVIAAATRPQPPQRETDDRPIAGGWASYYRTVRRSLVPGREAWRNTYR
ncbi:MAG: acyl-CoA carboxylase subunit epsilon [Propionibacteriaceae bacterium]|nr:acyl-CoA carboxylase subunit epsilon [Propionibacteriaceae bacterium]